MRFFYIFFLEFCICILLQMSVADMTSTSSSVQFYGALALGLVVIALVTFISSLFCFRGPWVSGFY